MLEIQCSEEYCEISRETAQLEDGWLLWSAAPAHTVRERPVHMEARRDEPPFPLSLLKGQTAGCLNASSRFNLTPSFQAQRPSGRKETEDTKWPLVALRRRHVLCGACG